MRLGCFEHSLVVKQEPFKLLTRVRFSGSQVEIEVAEWLKAEDCKSFSRDALVESNPHQQAIE